MNLEIERRFLVDPSRLPKLKEGKLIRQAYFFQAEPSLRVRLVETRAFLTLKFPLSEKTRREFEYKITFRDGLEIFNSAKARVEKIRHLLTIGQEKWVIDFFQKENYPLVLAEIELDDEKTEFEKPLWIKEEVTQNPRYTSQSLAFNPTSAWPERLL